ncbi:MAG: M1 family metallopeptidase, partial [Acidobacteria bacterium]|nr:M1 family metallopeptidase [Acidobacteriota bacterium]
MKAIPATGLTVCILLLGLVPEAIAQGGRGRMPIPRIDVLDYSLDVTLIPEEHELQAVARMVFRPLERTETVLLEISENLSIRRVLDAAGVEILFRQDELGPGLLSLHFATPLEVKQDVTVTVEYEGGFDRDRYSRNYTRDESTAYIGLEGSYLLYAA